MLVTEALERSTAAVILSASVRRDGEPDRGRGFAELMANVAVGLVSGWGSGIGKGRECQLTIRVEEVVSAGREWPRRERQRALGSDEDGRKGAKGE